MLLKWRIAAVVKAAEDRPVAGVQYDIHWLWPDQKGIHDPWRLPARSCDQITSSSPETKLQRPQSVRSAPGSVPRRVPARASQNKKGGTSELLSSRNLFVFKPTLPHSCPPVPARVRPHHPSAHPPHLWPPAPRTRSLPALCLYTVIPAGQE
ncbi:hypothetical protein BV20DRAFT_568044 [Pilatotrama ljubarskyi]|nr:hypothetical protein BV20DRAFT_568044 [Pilatotrama ljubarskyi]